MQDIVWIFICGYISSTILFLSFSVFIRSFRNRMPQYLAIANGLLLILLFINLFFWIKDTAWPLLSTEKKEYEWQVRNIYSYVYFLSVPVLGFLFQLLFVKKSLRTKKWTTIVSLLLLCTWLALPYVVAVFTSYYRDYLPGSWEYYRPTVWEILVAVSASCIYFLICWIPSRPAKTIIA